MDVPPQKPKAGWPKGTKDKPRAKSIGRPRKDGLLSPQKWTATNDVEGQTGGAFVDYIWINCIDYYD